MQNQSQLNIVLSFLSNCRYCIQNKIPLPIHQTTTRFNFLTLQHEIVKQQPVILNLKSLNLVARLTQLLIQIIELLQTSKISTKRALYYKYLNLYQNRYLLLHQDLRLLCISLKLNRRQLNIVASSKGIANGYMTVIQNQHLLQVSRNNNFYIPNTVKIRVKQIFSKTVIIVQKQAIFNYLVMNSRNPHYLFVTSKGYPDYITQQFLLELAQMTNQFYYLGDLDPFGFDIMLKYALGDSIQGFGLINIEWLDLQGLIGLQGFNFDILHREYFDYQKSDQEKINQVLGQQLLGSLPLEEFDLSTPNLQIIQKIQRWKVKILKFRELQKKIQIQGILKCMDRETDIVQLLITNAMIV